MRLQLACSLLFAIAAIGCGDDGDGPCNPSANSGCEDGLVCEVVTGGEPACFAPLVMRGDVFDVENDGAIEGARVVALDVNGTPRTSVAVTDAEGDYELRIPSERNAEGVPVAVNVSLRVDAATYQSFPFGIRQAIPIDTTAAVKNADNIYVVESALTRVGLLKLTGDVGTGSIAGKVEVPPSTNGVLVVAETANTPGSGHSAIADTNGDYVIFNLPAGEYTVRAYAQGANYVPGMVSLAAAQKANLDLALSDAAASNVSGTVTLVEGAMPTSVILVVASTFNEVLARGETPPGLRAPGPGVAPNIEGPWAIEGVPAGRYVVLAGFENDGGVRDQSGTGNTALVFIDVAEAADLPIDASFKVTTAIPMVGPGADAPEAVTAAPTLTWMKDSSAKDYHVQVFDALGNVTMDHHTMDGAITSVPYSGPLVPGMYYQFRVTSYDDAMPTPFQLASTEDLRGVFFVP